MTTTEQGPTRVTTLPGASSVTIGPDGPRIRVTGKPQPKLAIASPFRPQQPQPQPAVESRSSEKEAPREWTSEAKAAMIAEEDAMYWTELTRNGYEQKDSHLFAQSADTVTISFFVPLTTKGKDVTLFRVFESDHTSDRIHPHCITFNVHRPHPSAPGTGASADGVDDSPDDSENITELVTLRHRVKLDEDLLLGCWSLHSFPSLHRRVMSVTLWKEYVATPHDGGEVRLWWDKCLETDTESVQTELIAERAGKLKQTLEFKRVWKEAHEQFQKRVSERKGRVVGQEDA